MGLDREQTGNAISLAISPHLPLGVTRTGELSMWKGCARCQRLPVGSVRRTIGGQGHVRSGRAF